MGIRVHIGCHIMTSDITPIPWVHNISPLNIYTNELKKLFRGIQALSRGRMGNVTLSQILMPALL